MLTLKGIRYILYIAEFIALISAVYSFKRSAPIQQRALPIYFLFIVFAEYVGRHFDNARLLDYTRNWYGFFVIPIEFLFFYWFLWKHFARQKERRWIALGAVLFMLSLAAEWLFFYDTNATFISLSYTMGNLILLVFILMYFNGLVHSKRILNFTRELEFWICSGLLLFYLCTFPFFGLYNYFLEKFPEEFRIYYVVMLLLNILMYGIFSFGMIWTRRK